MGPPRWPALNCRVTFGPEPTRVSVFFFGDYEDNTKKGFKIKRTFSILSEDNPGVLMRVAGLIYRRGYNIESLSVGRTNREGISRFTIVIEGEESVYEQIRKQLEKLIE